MLSTKQSAIISAIPIFIYMCRSFISQTFIHFQHKKTRIKHITVAVYLDYFQTVVRHILGFLSAVETIPHANHPKRPVFVRFSFGMLETISKGYYLCPFYIPKRAVCGGMVGQIRRGGFANPSHSKAFVLHWGATTRRALFAIL